MGRPRGERKFGRRIERNAVGLEHREWVRSSYPILRATGSQSFKQGSDRVRFFFWSLSPATLWRRDWRKQDWMQGGELGLIQS